MSGAAPARFTRDTATVGVGGGRHRAVVDRGWWIERGPNGGYLAAIVVRAMTAEVADADRWPRTLTIHYLAPPTEGQMEVEVTVERSGRSLTSLSARLVQGDVLIGLALAAFSRSRPVEGFDDRVPPAALSAGPDAIEPLVRQVPIPLAERFQVRPVIGTPSPAGAEGVAGGWIELVEPAPLDAALVAALTDAWPPAVFNRIQGLAAVPTIELTIHFRHPVADPAAGEPCFVRFRTRSAVEGFIEEEGEVWSSDGDLLAQSRQLAAFIPIT